MPDPRTPPPRGRTLRCLLLGLALGTGVAAVLAWRQPDQFRSQATLVPSTQLDWSSGESRSPAVPEQLIQIAQSQFLRGRVRDRLGEVRDSPVPWPESAVRLEVGRQNKMLLLSVVSTNYAIAKDFVTTWAIELVDFSQQQRRGVRATALATVEQRILQVERAMEVAQKELDNFLQKHHLAPGADPAGELEVFISRLTQERQALETQRVLQQATAVGVDEPGAGKLLELRFEQRRLANRLANLPAGTPPETRAELETELNAREADAQSLVGLLEEVRTARLATLEARHEALTRRLEALRSEVPEAAGIRRARERLDAERRGRSEQLAALQRERMKVEVLPTEEDLMVVQAGIGSSHPVGPDRPRILLQGACYGTLAGLVLRLGLALRRRSPAA